MTEEVAAVETPTAPTPTFNNPTFDRLFNRAKLKSVPVSVEVEGESFDFLAHEMSVSAKGRFESMMFAAQKSAEDEDTLEEDADAGEMVVDEAKFSNYKAQLVASFVTTPDNQPICAADEWRMILQMPNTVIEPLFKAVFELNGLGSMKEKRKSETDAENE